MTYTFKLARRLAISKFCGPMVLLLLAIACSGDTPSEVPASPETTPSLTEPGVAGVVLTPREVTAETGQNIRFTGFGRSAAGDSMDAAIEYTATGGSMSPDGVFSAPTTGTFRIIGRPTGAVTGVATKPDTGVVFVVAAQPAITAVVIDPMDVSVKAGGTTVFVASGRTSTGAKVPIGVTWTATGGTIDASGKYTAGGVNGSYRVIATAASSPKADTSIVNISGGTSTPVLAAVVLNPMDVSLNPGMTTQFAVSGKMSDGATVPVAVTYTATGGTIDASGKYTAGSANGTYRVIATAVTGGKADTSTVNISTGTTGPVLAAVVLNPMDVSLKPGMSTQFAVSGKMSDGATVPVNVTWSATGGTIDAGKYTAGGANGTYRVIATAVTGGKADTSTVTISGGSTGPVLTAVALNPMDVSVNPGGTVQFVVSGKMSDGTTVPVTVTYTAGGGTITAGGLYTAGQVAGSYKVIATQAGGSLADTSTVSIAGSGTTPPPVEPPPPVPIPGGPARVFPGAEGYGTNTRAGRAGKLIRVTNLNDNGPGSFRAAVTTAGPRTVIFDVSGQINLSSPIFISSASNGDDPRDGTKDFLTIAGQTAPSPGITIKGSLIIRASDVLVQHLRVRPGNSGGRRDAIMVQGPLNRVVLDHISVSWAGGGGKNLSTYNVTDVTVSNGITSEAFPYGMLISENDVVSVVRTLFAHNFDRNPQVKGGSRVTLVNNEVYNPGGKGRPFMGVWNNPAGEPPKEGPNYCNIIGNTAKVGPTGSGLAYQFQFDLLGGSQCYMSDNAFGFIYHMDSGVTTGMKPVGSPPFALPNPLTVLPSSQVESYLRANAGARPADRDPVDIRIMNDVINRSGNSLITNESQVGGHPALAQNTRVLSIPANYAELRPSGYTVLEENVLFPLAAQVEGRR
jgi:hypothetical protein